MGATYGVANLVGPTQPPTLETGWAELKRTTWPGRIKFGWLVLVDSPQQILAQLRRGGYHFLIFDSGHSKCMNEYAVPYMLLGVYTDQGVMFLDKHDEYLRMRKSAFRWNYHWDLSKQK
ncbi:unnamed protein product [Cuscuta epithymum]|uniref:Uncharacterized protein n=1 Tax=Cuscuta epithymum TaxID=186058 RepID=A0AAV0FU70_9ASTE|nr:unnamed protein product [Cuscuta epithymum]